MRFNFKKISAIASSVLLAGMTMGVAAAANYPAPFVVGSTSDVAIVYGTGTGVSTLDQVEATNIQTDLSGSLVGTGPTTTTGGDSIKLERSSDKFNLGDSGDDVYVISLTDNELPSILTDGTFLDDNNDEFDFTQKISLGNNINLTHFENSDYKDDVPTIGIEFPSSAHVLNYTMDFTTNPDFDPADIETTTLTLMGKDYYVLDLDNTSTSANTTTLLDSASSAVIQEDGAQTIQGKSVSIDYISSTEVALIIDGTSTKSLEEGQTYKLSDGSYVGIKDIRYSSKEGTTSSVEISLGSGKLKITDGSAIELNDDTIEEITGWLSQSSNKLDKIVLEWTTDDEEFVASDSELLMPGFESIKLSMGSMNYAAEEDTVVKNDGNDRIRLEAPIEDGVAEIYLLYSNSTGEFDGIGKDSSNLLVTTDETTIVFNETANHKWFVASWNATSEAESYLLSATITQYSNDNRTTIKNEVTNENICEYLDESDTCSVGSVVLTVNSIYDVGSNEWANFSINSGGSFNTLYTEEGMKVYLPYYDSNQTTNKGGINFSSQDAQPAGHSYASFYLFFAEEDKNDNLALGTTFNLTLDESGTSDKIHVSDVDSAQSEYEIGETDDYETYIVSDLATMIIYDTGGDQDWATITYHGEQAYADVYVTAPEVTVSAVDGVSLGNVVLKDTEATMSTKNLIVVGGSCINSVAATLVGGAYCGAAFTEATGVGSGQYLVKSYDNPNDASKIALLVAGYEVADTQAASQYVTTQTFDTGTVNKIGTTATVV